MAGSSSNEARNLRPAISQELTRRGCVVLTQHGGAYSGRGRADLVVLDGRYVTLLEIKNQQGHLSPPQESFLRRARRRGIPAYMVRSVAAAVLAVQLTRKGSLPTMTQPLELDLSFLDSLDGDEPSPTSADAAVTLDIELGDTVSDPDMATSSEVTELELSDAVSSPKLEPDGIEILEVSSPEPDLTMVVMTYGEPQPGATSYDGTSRLTPPVQAALNAVSAGLTALAQALLDANALELHARSLEVAPRAPSGMQTINSLARPQLAQEPPAHPPADAPDGKPKRKRRTKAEMEAARAEEAVTVNRVQAEQDAVSSEDSEEFDFDLDFNDLPGGQV